ncbi:ArsR family transcriptional regulator [Thermococcus celericrescens]|uniref:ArsR family transcriptional regulator n=1 Tax=Thermococcus celericrescens TaxID=227598 RepID=A0A100XWZ0_9EURY|nr:winged helix-turn-helix domain-containing protein [Thermococcus celericrescens]KUH32726.1 ArsR family transcriptional regulator [Thermococcus celericrescens]
MREVLIITEPEKVKVLSEGTRLKILQLLRDRPMTVNELSDILGKDRTTIYRHIKMLENAGLVEELEVQGNERVYSRTARLYLIKADPDESVEKFRQAYLQVEAEKLVQILEKAGFKIKNREKLVKLAKEVLDEIEINSQSILKRISQANIELTEIELFHLLNMLVFMQSCELCGKAQEARQMIEDD